MNDKIDEHHAGRPGGPRRCRPLVALVAAMLTSSPSLMAADPVHAVIEPAEWPAVTWPLAKDPKLERRIDALLAKMTVEEKVAQTIQGDIASITPEDVRKYRLGSILAGGSSDPGGKYNATPAQWLALADAFYEASMDTSGGGKAIPIIWGIDAMHGQSNIVGATLFPHNVGLGATRNPELLREIARITAVETRVTGMEWTFAPTVAVPQDDRWGRAYEGYSENPELVASFAGAFVEGLQGRAGDKDFLGEQRVVSSVKHFLGDGGTTGGRDQGETSVSANELRDIHAAGYVTAIAAGAQSVMASFNSFHGQKLHGHKPLLTDVLKDRMNFGGFVVGDWNGHGQLPGCSNTACVPTYLAGMDMPMAPDSWKGLYESTLAAARVGSLPAARLDDAVRRILRVKFRLGLFEAGKPSQRALGGKFELMGAPAHRAVARQAVRESLVLLKNHGRILPLAANQRLLVAGDGAHNLGKQSGGWTLTWQGSGTQRSDFPNADSIWEGILAQVRSAGGQAELAVDGNYKAKPDAAIVVFGEEPYAEFQGDRPNLLYKPNNDADLELIKRLKDDGIPVVAVFLSGRPLWMNREINAADAFVAAWLPGGEGGGIADVLLRKADGSVNHDFKGKLSFSWPRRADQYANNIGQPGYDPLFAYGHGLTYADAGELAALPEESGVDPLSLELGVYFARGVATAGMSLALVEQGGGATVVSTAPAQSGGDKLRLSAVDHRRQEDARRVVWEGDGAIELRSAAPLSLMREAMTDGQIVATLRIESLPPAGVSFVFACGEGCAAELPVGDWLASLPKQEWIRVAVPVRCLFAAGANAGNMTAPFGIRGSCGLALSISQVENGDSYDHRYTCILPPPFNAPGVG